MTEHRDDGRRILHKDDLKVLLQEAARQGAMNALKSLGLDDEQAAEDIKEIRTWLDIIRQAKTEAMKTAVKLLTTLAVTALLAGIAIKMKLFGQS